MTVVTTPITTTAASTTAVVMMTIMLFQALADPSEPMPVSITLSEEEDLGNALVKMELLVTNEEEQQNNDAIPVRYRLSTVCYHLSSVRITLIYSNGHTNSCILVLCNTDFSYVVLGLLDYIILNSTVFPRRCVINALITEAIHRSLLVVNQVTYMFHDHTFVTCILIGYQWGVLDRIANENTVCILCIKQQKSKSLSLIQIVEDILLYKILYYNLYNILLQLKLPDATTFYRGAVLPPAGEYFPALVTRVVTPSEVPTVIQHCCHDNAHC